MRSRYLLIGIAALLAFGASSSASAATVIVTMTSGNTFQPRSIIISLGDTVTWQNPAGGVTHSVIADDNSFTSTDITGGQTFSLVFNNAGNIPYHCGHHGQAGGIGMSGTIFVGNRTQHAANEHVLQLFSYDFSPLSSSTTWNEVVYGGAGVYRFCPTNWGYFQTGVSLPTGSEITGFELDGCDTDSRANYNVVAYFYAGSSYTTVTSEPAACPGYYSAPLSEAVDNLGRVYYLEVSVAPSDGTNGWIGFQAVRVYYKSSISYPPANPSFGDVAATHPFYRYIEALSAAGITAGCGSGNYCPDAAVTRGQMAVFLARSLGLFWPN